MSGWAGKTASGLLISAGSVVFLAVLFLSAELLTRAIFAERCERAQHEGERIESSRRYLAPCFRPERRDGQAFLVSTAEESGGSPVRVPRRRPAGVARVAVVGESSADLLAKRLADRLQAPGCDGRYEVLNCAQPGSGLEHVERRFDEVLAYEPDAVVLLFGHNILFEFELDESKLRLQGVRAKSCILSQLAPAPPATFPSLDVRLAKLEAFLHRAAAATRAKGIVLAIATMPGNLWLPPAASPVEEYDPRFLEAQFLAARGRSTESIRLLEALTEEHDSPFWHYQLGVQLARTGDDDHAYRELHLALDADHAGMRAPDRLNDLLRRVAKEEGLPLRDTERAVEGHAPGRLPGWESFVDNCHLLPRALDREVDGLLPLLAEATPLPACEAEPRRRAGKGLTDVLRGVFQLAASGPEDLARRWYRGLALAVESWVRRDPEAADRDVDEFLAGPSFAQVQNDPQGGALLVAVAEGYHRAGHPERAHDLNRRARDIGSTDAWVQKGLFLLREDRPREARAAFEQALNLDSSRADARAFLAFLSPQGSN